MLKKELKRLLFFRRKNKLIISVIIPAYNCISTLNKAVQSILNQTIKDLEVIIVDDGSTDGTSELADALAARWKRVKAIHQKNSGPMAARVKGINNATGTWVGFVDSDDWIEPNMYETMIETAEKENVSIVQCNFTTYTEKNCQESRWYWIPGKYKVSDEKVLSNKNYDIGHMISKIYKLTELNRLNIQAPDCDIGEDLLFNIEAYYKLGKMVIIDNPFYHYVIRNNSLAHKYLNKERRLKFIRACDALYRKYKGKSSFMRLWNQAFPFLQNVCIRKTDPNEIDLVVPYVDSSDPEWKKLYSKTTGKSVDDIRFNDYNMFPIFWRCLDKNLKDASIIHLVVQSESQVPKWLNTKNIHVVTHDLFVPNELLPIYNSTAFEVFIPQIVGLTNKFVYTNDDIYFMRQFSLKNCFKNEAPVNNIYNLKLSNPTPNWQHIVDNSCKLACNGISNDLVPKPGITYCMPHTIKALTVKSSMDFFKEHKRELINSVTKFRDDKNVNIYTYCIADYVRKKCLRSNPAKLKVVDLTSTDKVYYAIANDVPDILCINATEKGDIEAPKIKNYLTKLWYKACSYELYNSMS